MYAACQCSDSSLKDPHSGADLQPMLELLPKWGKVIAIVRIEDNIVRIEDNVVWKEDK